MLVGLSLKSECKMSFRMPHRPAADVCCSVACHSDFDLQVEALLPRRSLMAMSGEARYVWMHGIKSSHLNSPRVSITFRKLKKDTNSVQGKS